MRKSSEMCGCCAPRLWRVVGTILWLGVCAAVIGDAVFTWSASTGAVAYATTEGEMFYGLAGLGLILWMAWDGLAQRARRQGWARAGIRPAPNDRWLSVRAHRRLGQLAGRTLTVGLIALLAWAGVRWFLGNATPFDTGGLIAFDVLACVPPLAATLLCWLPPCTAPPPRTVHMPPPPPDPALTPSAAHVDRHASVAPPVHLAPPAPVAPTVYLVPPAPVSIV